MCLATRRYPQQSQYNLDGSSWVKCHSQWLFEDVKRQNSCREESTCYVEFSLIVRWHWMILNVYISSTTTITSIWVTGSRHVSLENRPLCHWEICKSIIMLHFACSSQWCKLIVENLCDRNVKILWWPRIWGNHVIWKLKMLKYL